MPLKKLLIIGYTWPEPRSTAAGNRMLQLIRFFLDEDYQITFSSTASESELSMDLELLGISKIPIQLNHSSFDAFIGDLKPDVVLFDRFLTEEQFGWRVAESAPNALRILDTEDLHSLRHTREKAFKAGVDFTTDLWVQNEMTKREIASIYRCDLSLIISSYEMQLLQEVIKMDDHILIHLPFMVEKLTESQTSAWKPFEARKDFICIGNGKHAPNVDAIVWLKKELWPLLHEQLPGTKLHIYGAYLPQHIQQMHKPSEGFYIEGWADDIKEVMGSAIINLAPLRFGAGLKGKLLDAMRYGTSSVTTAIGAEGMYGNLEFNGAIADHANDFAKAAIDLYQNNSRWSKAQYNGAKIINTLFDKEVHQDNLRVTITTICNNLKAHRTKNFLGQLLLHQTLASTKYLSKWIEEKGR